MRKLFQLLARRWQSIPLMDRWLLSELIGPLLFGVAAFTAVTLSVGVVFELVRKVAESGLSIAVATQVLFLKLPGFLVLSFPMATLMATLLAYSRLSGGSELTALRSIGVSTMRFILPAIFLASLMSGLTFMFNDLIVPPANRSGYVTLQKALGRSIDSEKGENIIYPRYGKVVGSSMARDKERLVHLFYARDYFNGAMVDVTLLDFSRPNSRQMLTAKLARYDQKSGNWEFINGNVINISENGGMNTTAEFDSYFYPLGQGPLDLAELPRDANNMTVAQAREGLRILDQAGDRKEARKLRVRIQEKFSFPAICLVFGLIGASLGSRPNGRTSRSQGFGISVLLIFLYYLLAFVFSSLGVKGTLTPLLSAWSPVFIGLLGGAFLLREASQ
ncbi:MAG: LptF/LptG family permease [Synechococcus sp. SupBloom_Metag_053]|nr:LptF/LptG family permease [Synechococcus sp. SupBloom_Metag_053]